MTASTPRTIPLSTLVLIVALTAIIAAVIAFAPPAMATGAPEAPKSVTGNRSGQTITVNWEKVTGTGITYNINHSNDAKRSWQRTKSDLTPSDTDNPSYAVDNTWLNADYTFAVQACNASGQCSGWEQSGLVAGANKPNPPSVVHVKHKGTWVKFWWPKPPGGASTYDIVASTNHKANWSRLFTGYRQNVAHITNGDRNKTYYIAVRACNHSGSNGDRECSGWRNSEGAQRLEPDDIASVSATFTGAELTATWPATPGATKYHATYACKKGQSIAFGSNHMNITGTSESQTVDLSKTQDGKTAKGCWVGVRAGNSHGWSKWKNSAPATQEPEEVSSLQVSNSPGHWHVTWEDSENAGVTYEVQASGDGTAWGSLKTVSDKKADYVHSAKVDGYHNEDDALVGGPYLDVQQKQNFRVRACEGANCSEYTETGAKPDSGPGGYPYHAFLGRAVTGCTVDLAWSDMGVDNMSYYLLNYGVKGYNLSQNIPYDEMWKGPSPVAGEPDDPKSQWVNIAKAENLQPNTEYEFRIGTRNAHATGPWTSQSTTATTGSCGG